jgi:integrase
VRPNYRPRSAKEVERLLNKLSLQDRHLPDIKVNDITDVLDRLPPSEANHCFGVLRTFFGWAERRELVARSPCAKLTKPHKEKTRDRVLNADEIRAIWHACKDDSFGCIIKLALCSGQRRGQLAAIEPSWIEGETGVISFPAGIMKAKREHSIPLTPFSLKLAHAVANAPTCVAWSKPRPRQTKRGKRVDDTRLASDLFY